DGHRETALDLAGQHAGDDALVLEGLLEFLPGLGATRLFARQAGVSVAVFESLDGDLDLVADRDRQFAVDVLELGRGDLRLRLQAGIDDDVLVVGVDDLADDDLTGLHHRGLQALFEKFSKRFRHIGRRKPDGAGPRVEVDHTRAPVQAPGTHVAGCFDTGEAAWPVRLRFGGPYGADRTFASTN